MRQTKSCDLWIVEGMVLPSSLVGPRTNVGADTLTASKLPPGTSASRPLLQRERHFTLEELTFPKHCPAQKTLQKATYRWETCFLMVPSLDSVVFGASQPARLVWMVTRATQSNNFDQQLFSTAVVPSQSPSTHEESHFHWRGCFRARTMLVTLPEKHSLWGLLEIQILPAFYTPLKNKMQSDLFPDE